MTKVFYLLLFLSTSTSPQYYQKGMYFTSVADCEIYKPVAIEVMKQEAAQAGFTPEERWALQQKHRDFKGAQKAGTMDEFVEKYPQSQTAKERAIGNRIPTSMDMDF